MRLILAPLPLTLLALALPALAQDSDLDSTPDGVDPFPCDPLLDSEYYVPAEGVYGAFLFEDQWPEAGDADFNDAVVAYNYVLHMGRFGLSSMTLTFHPLAVGGDFRNGLGAHLPVSPARVSSVTRTVGGAAPEVLTPSPSDVELTVRVSDDLREAFGGQTGPINSISGPSIGAQSIVVRIDFTSPISPRAIARAAPLDVFIFRTLDPSHEIHRTAFGGTSNMNTALFGTFSDNSAPGRYFVDGRNLPFVLELPVIDVWPSEGTDIARLFPRIIEFATSSGAAARDFYVNGVDPAHAYQGSPVVVPPPIQESARDRSCTVDSDGDGYTAFEETRNGSDPLDPADPDLLRVGAYSSARIGNALGCGLQTTGKIDCWGYDTQDHLASAPAAARFVELDSGTSHMCAITTARDVECWGSDSYGAVSDAPTTGTWIDISCYGQKCCALETRGGISCWGRDDYGTVSGAPTSTNWIDVAVGNDHVCALASDRSLHCWGRASTAVTGAPPSYHYTSVASGYGFSCATSSFGHVSCWGGSVPHLSGLDYRQVEVGLNHACALDGVGRVRCWGSDFYGEVSGAPTGTGWKRIARGAQCAIDSSDRLACWGRDNHGNVSTAPPGNPQGHQLEGPWTSIWAAGRNSCVLDAAGHIECWGAANSFGTLSNVPTTAGWTSLGVGHDHMCAVNSAGALSCWGRDQYGQVSGAPSGVWTTVVSGVDASCALDALGAIQCWGNDFFSVVSGAPLGGGWSALSGNQRSFCAIDGTGTIRCWGLDSSGQVSTAPTSPGWVSVAVGDSHACALDAAGNIACWGADYYGKVSGHPTSGGWRQIGVAGTASCASRDDGTVQCWGGTVFGLPAEAPTSSGWLDLAVADQHACAISAAGERRCWGLYHHPVWSEIRGRDVDRDGLNDLQENTLGTSRTNADTDGDGRTDGFEVRAGTNPRIAD